MATQQTKGSRFLRGFIKTIFILCYIAFMWASIHKVAYFFSNFEAEGNGTVSLGSYLLAGAFDLTALVTTIGVMFFRKSMPKYVQIILWAFIVGIVVYTFFINWEYDSHFQGASLALQPTGATLPVFDKQGVLHYEPEMKLNTTLLFVNPLIASGFTVFALIYSVVAEFFGTKQPTAAELQERLDYLNSVSEIQQKLQEAEAKNKKPGLIATAKEKVLEVKKAANEVLAKPEKVQPVTTSFTAEDQEEDTLTKTVVYLQQNPQATDEMLAAYLGMQRPASARFWRLKAMMLLEQSSLEDIVAKAPGIDGTSENIPSEPVTEDVSVVDTPKSESLPGYNDISFDTSPESINESKTSDESNTSPEGITTRQGTPNLASLNYAPDVIEVLKRYPGIYTSWLSQEVKSVTIEEIVQVTKQPKRRVQYQVGKALKRTPRGADKILIGSVIEWLKTAPIPEQVAEHVSVQSEHHNGHDKDTSTESNPLDYPEYQPASY